jgi:hypothetical protein
MLTINLCNINMDGALLEPQLAGLPLGNHSQGITLDILFYRTTEGVNIGTPVNHQSATWLNDPNTLNCPRILPGNKAEEHKCQAKQQCLHTFIFHY